MKNQAGFSLLELLIAMTLSALLLLSVERLLPQLWLQATASEQRRWARDEIQRVQLVLEKAVRRAGFCAGDKCQGLGLEIRNNGKCLLIRWDDNFNGVWEGPASQQSDYFGYRYRDDAIETARGVSDCLTGQWSRLNTPSQVKIVDWQAKQIEEGIEMQFLVKAGKYSLRRRHLINRENK